MNLDQYSSISSDESEGSCYIACKSIRESSGHDSHHEIRKSPKCSRLVSSEPHSLRNSVEPSSCHELDYELEKREHLQKGKECINKLLIEINELETLYREISENAQSSGIVTSVSSNKNGKSNYFSCSNSDEMESYQLPRDRDRGVRNEQNPKYIVHLDPEKEDVMEVYCKLDEFLENKYLRKKVQELERALKHTKSSSSIDNPN
nr:hypothetical protein HmN_000058600 [Hymenolepis microstoma]